MIAWFSSRLPMAARSELGRIAPGHPGQSAVCGGECPGRATEHAGACRHRSAAGTAYSGFLRTGRLCECDRAPLLVRIAREGNGLGRSQRFPSTRRTLAAADHRKPWGFRVRLIGAWHVRSKYLNDQCVGLQLHLRTRPVPRPVRFSAARLAEHRSFLERFASILDRAQNLERPERARRPRTLSAL